MKRPSDSTDTSTPTVRLLLNCVDGTIPFLTPYLLKKYVVPSDDFFIGMAVRDSCVVAQYKHDKTTNTKNNKPSGYTFGFKGLDSHLMDYNRVTVPSFDLLQDAVDNDSIGVSANNDSIQVWTPQGRHTLPCSLYNKVARDLKSQVIVPCYDMALQSESKKRRENASRRCDAWLNEFVNDHDPSDGATFWAPIVLGLEREDRELPASSSLGGIVFIGETSGVDLFSELQSHLRNVRPTDTIALLSARSTLEFIEAVRAGVNVVGTALPQEWAKKKRAFVVPFVALSRSVSKRARVSEHGDDRATEVLDFNVDGCVDMNDSKFSRDALPLIPGCTCLACSNSHSRAYIHHLVQAKELLAEILLFAHNLHRLREMCRALSTDMDSTYGSIKTCIAKSSQ